MNVMIKLMNLVQKNEDYLFITLLGYVNLSPKKCISLKGKTFVITCNNPSYGTVYL